MKTHGGMCCGGRGVNSKENLTMKAQGSRRLCGTRGAGAPYKLQCPSSPRTPSNRSSANPTLITPHPHLLPNTLGNHRKEIHSQAVRGSWDSQVESWGGCDPGQTICEFDPVPSPPCIPRSLGPSLLQSRGVGGGQLPNPRISVWSHCPPNLQAGAAQGHSPRRPTSHSLGWPLNCCEDPPRA